MATTRLSTSLMATFRLMPLGGNGLWYQRLYKASKSPLAYNDLMVSSTRALNWGSSRRSMMA
ncbi:Uncharacterised protein [Bordetella pertussis]|nr:Uncharacterised protein [Bordetella pertussis]CPI94302.1 Uncharacterised protein [Bordetella pertussis]CPM71782.1 Uncharacterised protein [Bordetella pertussis]CPO35306.1 Uncharacterised protein [Bordetella pertussis]